MSDDGGKEIVLKEIVMSFQAKTTRKVHWPFHVVSSFVKCWEEDKTSPN